MQGEKREVLSTNNFSRLSMRELKIFISVTMVNNNARLII